jgi:hypothetical protein
MHRISYQDWCIWWSTVYQEKSKLTPDKTTVLCRTVAKEKDMIQNLRVCVGIVFCILCGHAGKSIFEQHVSSSPAKNVDVSTMVTSFSCACLDIYLCFERALFPSSSGDIPATTVPYINALPYLTPCVPGMVYGYV